MPTNSITRNGFSCSYGRFFAEPGRVECVSGTSLWDAFLPKLSPVGNQLIRDGGASFVRGQFKHYDVAFDERDFSGNGTLLLKKILKAGKCDKVPGHIARLRAEMHAEWLAQLTIEEISNYPEWAMEKYFLTSGQPDRAKTLSVIGFPQEVHSSYRAGQMRKAASGIAGLHQATGHGPKTQTIYMGWDFAAVEQAAKEHAAKEARAVKAADDEREKERAEEHASYLKGLKKRKGPLKYSPIGQYIIDCRTIEEGWSITQADDWSFDIYPTDQEGVFEASFDFGVHEGIMVMSTDEKILDEYCSQLDTDTDDNEDDYDEDDDDDDDDDAARVETGSKRKTPVSTARGHGSRSKKSRNSSSTSQDFHLKIRCTETGEGQIFPGPEKGTIKFEDKTMAKFSAIAGLPCVGTAVDFTGRKIADVVDGYGKLWSDYSERSAERARVSRWH
ncbi:hypothetical protein F5Y10DRAFT_256800 [Nemania abortiva]|nr:hypothetical protein F5Y10DRAFT_256800 [Nemania abortiva]